MRIITKQNYTSQFARYKKETQREKSLIQKFSYPKHSPLDEMEDCQTRTGVFFKECAWML